MTDTSTITGLLAESGGALALTALARVVADSEGNMLGIGQPIR
jgi:hypothetical protein